MMSQAQHEGHSLHDFYAEIQKAANEYGFEKIEDFGDAMTTIAFIVFFDLPETCKVWFGRCFTVRKP